MGATDPRRLLPSVDAVLTALSQAAGDLPHGLVVACARDAIDAARARIDTGEPVPTDAVSADAVSADAVLADAVLADALARADQIRVRLLRPVVNATGVLLHTNLGRAPIGESALAAATAVGRGYANLEYRLDEGQRGSRHEHAGALLARACGAEAGLVVNNGAAAVLLVLAAVARGRSVVVARGELVEIGGGFRIPEILAESGARLVEVGTTNRTRLADYAAAIDDATAAVLKVHASNYRMIGFVASTPVAELATLGPPVVVDAGSGLLDDTAPWLPGGAPHWLRDEPGVRQCLAAGATLVTFSGDKLLGGPQAGIVVGTAEAVARVARHPLARAVRADKLTLAALQDVAFAYLSGDATRIPLWRMASVSIDDLRARAEAIAARVGDRVKVVDTEAVAGGGALPGLTIPSVGVAIEVSPRSALARLRTAGVVARAEERAVVCDLRTVDPTDDEPLAAALAALFDAQPATQPSAPPVGPTGR